METDTQRQLLELPVARILVDASLQPRVGGLDADHVAALEENPEAWPPLVVVDDGGYRLVDGFHRLAAAQNLGLEIVRVEVHEMPDDGDVRGLAFRLNAAHGRPLTLADRRTEAERRLHADPAVSNMEVARATALSPTTIATIREQLEVSEAIPATDQRVSRAGVTYTPPSPRQPGELPPDREPLGAVFGSKERREQRRLVRYFERLATALDDGFAFDNWQSAEDGATACRAVLGNEAAEQLGQDLGPAATNVIDLAVALGYEDDES
jgi:hypothetical protein